MSSRLLTTKLNFWGIHARLFLVIVSSFNAGRPKLTWRRTVERDLREMKLTWGQAEIVAKDRVEWRGRVDALCSTGSRRYKKKSLHSILMKKQTLIFTSWTLTWNTDS